MNGKEVKAAIERLRSQCGGSFGYSLNDVANAFLGESHGMGIASSSKLRDALIALLEQADPDTHVELPKDADGLTWHIGDAIEDGTVLKEIMLAKYGWNFVGVPAIDPSIHRHFRLTVEEVLCEFASEWFAVNGDAGLVAEYANRIRELVRDEQR